MDRPGRAGIAKRRLSNFEQHCATLSNIARLRRLLLLAEAEDLARAKGDDDAALLSQVPLGNPSSFAFERPAMRGRKGFVIATLPFPAAPAGVVDVVSVHLDFLRKAIRRRQIHAMAAELAGRGNPLIVLGDLNCWWERRNDAIHLLGDQLGVRPCQPESEALATFPSLRPRLRLDWILVSRELDFGRYQVVADRVSDHLGVVAEIHAIPAA